MTDNIIPLNAQDAGETYANSAELRRLVAENIRNQITTGVLMSVGAHDMRPCLTADSQRPGLQMKVRVLPFNKDGRRSTRPRIMTCRIIYEADDTYTVHVYYLRGFEVVTHAYRETVFNSELAFDILSLGSDHDRGELD